MGKDKDGWCDFHQAFGHVTEDCWALKTQIEKMMSDANRGAIVREGQLAPAGGKGAGRVKESPLTGEQQPPFLEEG
ncbi:hypothetical protein CR513_15103, partial [Mucuna pruriens]